MLFFHGTSLKGPRTFSCFYFGSFLLHPPMFSKTKKWDKELPPQIKHSFSSFCSFPQVLSQLPRLPVTWAMGIPIFFYSFRLLDVNIFKVTSYMGIRVFHQNMFFQQQKISATHHASAWGLVWRNPKGFIILNKFKGSSSHLKFDHFYIVDFHSALASQVSVQKREGWVKIYNVKMVKF